MCVSSVFVFHPGFFCNLPEVMRLIVGGCAATNINYMSCCLKHSDKIRPNDRGRNTQGTSRDDINKTEKYSDCSEIHREYKLPNFHQDT